jgi:hypothetical protein
MNNDLKKEVILIEHEVPKMFQINFNNKEALKLAIWAIEEQANNNLEKAYYLKKQSLKANLKNNNSNIYYALKTKVPRKPIPTLIEINYTNNEILDIYSDNPNVKVLIVEVNSKTNNTKDLPYTSIEDYNKKIKKEMNSTDIEIIKMKDEDYYSVIEDEEEGDVSIVTEL